MQRKSTRNTARPPTWLPLPDPRNLPPSPSQTPCSRIFSHLARLVSFLVLPPLTPDCHCAEPFCVECGAAKPTSVCLACRCPRCGSSAGPKCTCGTPLATTRDRSHRLTSRLGRRVFETLALLPEGYFTVTVEFPDDSPPFESIFGSATHAVLDTLARVTESLGTAALMPRTRPDPNFTPPSPSGSLLGRHSASSLSGPSPAFAYLPRLPPDSAKA